MSQEGGGGSGQWLKDTEAWVEDKRLKPSTFAAEFIGSFLFQFLGGSAASNAVDAGLTTAALGNGAALALLVYSMAGISGAHLNPAVSTAMLVIGEDDMSIPKWGIYVSMQLFGALMGAVFLRYLCPDTAVVRNPFVTQGILNEGVSRNLAGLGIFEFVMTFTLVFVICAVALDMKSGARQYGPLAVGFVYAAGVYCEGPYTGGSMNPARTIAAAIVYANFTGMWISIICVMIGGVAGAFCYKHLLRIEHNPANSRDFSASRYV